MAEIHEIIRNRRIELDLTLKDVAKALGVSEGTVSRYETANIQNMGIDKIANLAKVLRCSPGYLMGWEDDPTPEGFEPSDIKSNPKGTGTRWTSDVSTDEEHLLEVYRMLNKKDKASVVARAEELRELDAFRRGVKL